MKIIRIEKGYYILKLDDILKEKHISKTKLTKEINTNFYTIQKILTGQTTRYDVYILANLCNFLNCKLSDIIEYIPD